MTTGGVPYAVGDPRHHFGHGDRPALPPAPAGALHAVCLKWVDGPSSDHYVWIALPPIQQQLW